MPRWTAALRTGQRPSNCPARGMSRALPAMVTTHIAPRMLDDQRELRLYG